MLHKLSQACLPALLVLVFIWPVASLAEDSASFGRSSVESTGSTAHSTDGLERDPDAQAQNQGSLPIAEPPTLNRREIGLGLLIFALLLLTACWSKGVDGRRGLH